MSATAMMAARVPWADLSDGDIACLCRVFEPNEIALLYDLDLREVKARHKAACASCAAREADGGSALEARGADYRSLDLFEMGDWVKRKMYPYVHGTRKCETAKQELEMMAYAQRFLDWWARMHEHLADFQETRGLLRVVMDAIAASPGAKETMDRLRADSRLAQLL